MKKFFFALCYSALTAVFLLCPVLGVSAANKYEAAMGRWTRNEEYKDDMGGRFIVKATLYTTDYLNNLLENEAEKNLWTASELEDFKYNLLKELKIDDFLPIHLQIEELGPTAHMAPFNEMVHLWVGNKKHSPAEYDQRFNLPLQGKRDGVVFFPRYDEKTGEPIFNRDTTLRFVMVAAASPILGTKEVHINWDVKASDVGAPTVGTAAERIEIDRLLKRMERLAGERSALEAQLESKKSEIEEINARIEELRKN